METDLDKLEKNIDYLVSISDKLSALGQMEPDSDSQCNDSDIDRQEIKEFGDPEDLYNLSEQDDEANDVDGMLTRVEEPNEDEPESFDREYYFDEAASAIARLSQDISIGDYTRLQYHLEEINTWLNRDIVARHLERFEINVDTIVFSIRHLLSHIEYNEPFIAPRIVNPEVIKELNEEFLYALAKEPGLLHKIDPRLFEELVAEIFRKFKLEVHLTKQTRDGGIDVIAFEDNRYTKNHYIIECKHYVPPRKVGVEVVRCLYGTKMHQQATKAFLVTSSYFSKEALLFAKQHAWELDLKDFDAIKAWLQLNWKKK